MSDVPRSRTPSSTSDSPALSTSLDLRRLWSRDEVIGGLREDVRDLTEAAIHWEQEAIKWQRLHTAQNAQLGSLAFKRPWCSFSVALSLLVGAVALSLFSFV